MALSTATVTLENQAAESKVIPKDDVKWIRRRRSVATVALAMIYVWSDSLTTNVCVGPTDNENEPAGETLQIEEDTVFSHIVGF
ncbi:hypothetical protein Bca101_051620 [Brassica carinata]